MAATFRFGLVLMLALSCAACSPTGLQRPGAASHSALTRIQQDGGSKTAVVRVTTDAHGKIVAVVIIKSTGSGTLDRIAVEDTKDQWHGAVSSMEDVTIRYAPGPNGTVAPTFLL